MEKKIFLVLSAVFFFVIFRWNQQGLAPDAALYAGLSLKVLQNGEFWKISASPNMFPHFFEHPPYFFQWGSQVLSVLGVSDGAARAIGGLPSLLAFIILMSWTYIRMGQTQASICFLMLLSFGHYTKYAASSYLEGPLSAGVLLALISTYEWTFQKHSLKMKRALLASACLGSALACASKGIAGLGVWGAIFLMRWIYPKKLSWSFVVLCLLSAISPMLVWAYKTQPTLESDTWYFMEYLNKQVLRSFTTNRGSLLHSESGSRWTYVGVILKYGWPWWWTVPAGIYYWRKNGSQYPLITKNFGPWIVLSLLCFFSFFIPFSLSHFQLPHYLHPVYLPLAPIGAYFLAEIIPKKYISIITHPALRWGLLLIFIILNFTVIKNLSSSANRGQEFIAVANPVNSLNSICTLYVSEKDIDLYRMESFSSWYFKNRNWKYITQDDHFEQLNNYIIWDPKTNSLQTQNCPTN
ncbi:MAG: hypothetical protein KA116_00365 [Proteobacteria bacterium]|nr:hypothetical protein [Pseudomonadota bacterium]